MNPMNHDRQAATQPDDAQLQRIAETLDTAATTATPTMQLDTQLPLAAAYRVQEALIGLRTSRGERAIGIKMGLTSRAKMAQVGVNEMNWGRLTDGMLIDDGGSVAASRFIHPRAEPELAFLLRAPLQGRITALQAWQAVDGVACAIEIIDSRYRDFKFSLADVIADNSSSSGLVIGAWHKRDMDISNLGMVLEIDGRVKQVGSSAAILGNPIRSLVAAARLVTQYGGTLRAGDIVMAGAATAAEPVRAGQRVSVRVERLGRACFSLEQGV